MTLNHSNRVVYNLIKALTATDILSKLVSENYQNLVPCNP